MYYKPTFFTCTKYSLGLQELVNLPYISLKMPQTRFCYMSARTTQA